jgi:photosystem II stability/assembly factor-like uncharacterized protein
VSRNNLLFLCFSFFILSSISIIAQEADVTQEPVYRINNEQAGSILFSDDPQPVNNSPWEWLHPSPNGNTLRWVKTWDADNWYAAGFGGTFLKTSDGGNTWFVNKQVNGLDATSGNETIYDAHFWDMNTGIVVGGFGTCYKTTDGGNSWDSLSSFPTAATCYDVYFLDDTLGFAVGTTSMRVYKTTNAGNTWEQIWGDLGSLTAYSVYALDENNIFVGSSSGNLRVTTNGGVNWSTVNVGFSSTLYKVTFTDPMNGWVAGSASHAAYTTDGGATWNDVSAGIPTGITFYDIDIINTSSSGSAMATVYPMSTDYWTGATDGTNKTETSLVKGIDTQDGWFKFDISTIPDGVTIDSVRFYGYVNETNWPYWSGTPLNIDPVSSSAADVYDTIQAGIESEVAYIYANESSGFSPGWHNYLMSSSAVTDLQTALTQDWFAMGMASRDDDSTYFLIFDGWNESNLPYLEVYYSAPVQPVVVLTGDAFDVYVTTDMGANWNTMGILATGQAWTSTFYSTDFISPTHFVAVGAYGLINEIEPVVDDNTAHTTWVKAGTLYDIWAENGTGRLVAVGAPGNPTSNDQGMYSTDGGNTWVSGVVSPGTDLDFNAVSMVSPLIGYAAGEDHIVYKTTDGGANWTAVTQPAVSTSDLEEIFFVDENNGYTFGASGNGYKTTDGGTSWTPVTTGMTGTIYGSFFLDVNTGFITGASGSVRKTTDGGATFNPQNADVGTSIVYSIWMVNNDLGYLTSTSGRVRKTTNGGTDWLPVDVGNTSPTLYDVEFKTAENGMVVGTLGRIYYTNDGGSNWVFENNGMGTVYAVALDHTESDTSAAYVCGTNANIMRNAQVILPVELAAFSASVSENNVTLNWQTATEINNSGFRIERQITEIENAKWIEVGSIQGYGTTSEVKDYSFTDKNVPVGNYNYRLKQIDFDGSYKYHSLSNVVEIGAPDNYNLSQNYPNPFNPTTTIKYALPVDGFVNLSVYNILGEKVTEIVNEVQRAGVYTINFDASNLSSGMYLYRIQTNDFESVKKMMIMK